MTGQSHLYLMPDREEDSAVEHVLPMSRRYRVESRLTNAGGDDENVFLLIITIIIATPQQ
jgi:hypothetical protein